MIELIDFTNSTISNRDLQYAGRAGEKRGIVLNELNCLALLHNLSILEKS